MTTQNVFDFYYNKAFSLFCEENYKEALDAFTKAHELDPENDSVIEHCARCYQFLKLFDSALNLYDKLLAKHPSSYLYLELKASLYKDWGKTEEYQQARVLAEEHKFTPAVKHDYWIFIREGSELFENGEYKKAIKAFSYAIDSRPEEEETYLLRGNCHMQLHDYDAAINDYSAAIQKKYDYAAAYTARSAAYKALGNIEKASEDTQMADKFNQRMCSYD